jgi:hypothetical protein
MRAILLLTKRRRAVCEREKTSRERANADVSTGRAGQGGAVVILAADA